MLTGVIFGFYILALLIVGYAAFRRTRGLSDYILGGRRIGRWVAALSAGASDMSGWLLLGLPGYAYLAGAEAFWLALGLWVGTYLNWKIIAKRLRNYSFILNDSLTLPEFFERRFGDTSHVIRVTSASFILLFFLFYTSAGLVAGGKLFNAVFDIPYHWALIAGAIVIVAYTFIGGFLAVSWTDVLQGLLMLFALLVVPAIVVIELGGFASATHAVDGVNPHLLNPFTDTEGVSLSGIALISLLGWGLGYFGQPHILARFKAVSSIHELAPARRIATTWAALCMTGAIAAGMAGIPYFAEPLGGGDNEKIFILLTDSIFPPLIAGVLLAAILAAIMSTADSQLLVSASAFTGDLYQSLFRPTASQTTLIQLGRIAVVTIAGIATLLAWNPDSQVLELVAYAWAGFGAAFGPTLLVSLYWRRMNKAGALAGIIVGGTTVVIWKQLEGGLFDVYELVPAFFLSLFSIFAVSLATAPPNETIAETFNRNSRDVKAAKSPTK